MVFKQNTLGQLEVGWFSEVLSTKWLVSGKNGMGEKLLWCKDMLEEILNEGLNTQPVAF